MSHDNFEDLISYRLRFEYKPTFDDVITRSIYDYKTDLQPFVNDRLDVVSTLSDYVSFLTTEFDAMIVNAQISSSNTRSVLPLDAALRFNIEKKHREAFDVAHNEWWEKRPHFQLAIDGTHLSIVDFIVNDPDRLEHFPDLDDDTLIRIGRGTNYKNYNMITNPSRKVTMEYLDLPENIKHVVDPTENMMLYAVRGDGMALQYIPEELQTEKVQRAAIHDDPRSFEFINNPSNKIMSYALCKSGENIKFIEKPTEKQQMKVVNTYGWRPLCEGVKNPCDKALRAALRDDLWSIDEMGVLPESIQLYAMQLNNSDDYCVISEIVQPTPLVQTKAVDRDIHNLLRINEPCAELSEKYYEQLEDLFLDSHGMDTVKEVAKNFLKSDVKPHIKLFLKMRYAI